MTSAVSSSSRSLYGWFALHSVVLAALILAILIKGGGPGNGGGLAATLWLTLGLALLPGFASGLFQIVVFPPSVRGSAAQWVAITLASVAVAWALAIGVYVVDLHFAIIPVVIGGLKSAIVVGISMGSSAGILIGLVVGCTQTAFGGSLLNRRTWILGTVISWWFAVTAPLTLMLAAISEIRFSF